LARLESRQHLTPHQPVERIKNSRIPRICPLVAFLTHPPGPDGQDESSDSLLIFARHSKAGWNPVLYQIAEELDPSLRWDDGLEG
jgi:hypothetical protein